MVSHSDNCLIDLIDQTFGGLLEDVTEWSIRFSPKRSRQWIDVRSTRVRLPNQGWKVHVSATAADAERVLRACLSVLLAEKATFKVVSSLSLLDDLNRGYGGESQIGKFLTVYPADDDQAVRLAVSLTKATDEWRGLGPAVPSDWPFAPASLVHYRYGGFDARMIQTAVGEIVPAITGPQGTLIPDRRTERPQLVSWLFDPFVAASCVEPQNPPGLLVGGRYMLNAILHQSPRGSVYLGLDCKDLRLCVLKAARRNSLVLPDGRNAWDRLRHEAAMLARIAPNPHVPRMLEVLEQDEYLYLVMDDIEGETLLCHLDKMNAVGRHVSLEQIISWGRNIAVALGTLHSNGIIHGDPNATNVLVAPNGEIHLLDFEFAHDLMDESRPYRLGTPGYMRPERHRDDLPVIADDIFGLGALLYFAATGAEPSQAPISVSLLQRPITSLNPQVPADLVAVIVRCLDLDPSARFSSMAGVRAALDKVTGEMPSVYSSLNGTSPARPTPQAQLDYRQLAHQLGDALCRAAQPAPDGRGLEWISTHDLSAGVPSYDVNTGSAGAVLALAELVGEIRDPKHRAALGDAAQRLVSDTKFGGPPLPGLYVGEAGIGAALLRAGQILRNGQLIAAAEQRGRKIAQYPFCSPDLFNGTAGRLRFHLWLWYETYHPEHLRDAVAAGEILLTTAEDAGGGGLRWTIPLGYDSLSGSAYLGYAHGAAGIGDALLDLFEATSDERFLAAATSAGRWIGGSAISALDDGSGLAWPITQNGKLSAAFWCHGATGIGRFFLHAAELHIPEAMDLAHRAARSVAWGTRWAGTTQCHGLAGSIEFLLDLFQRTRDSIYLDNARSLASVLRTFGTERDGGLLWPSESSSTFTPDYMLGYAGVAMAYLRLSAPDRLPHQLSVRCFRRTHGES
jgi:serine/threonine protein kinase